LSCSFLLYTRFVDPPVLPSFPTRRSSDLPALASCCHGFVSDLESHRALMPSVRTRSCITTPIAPASVISGRLPLRGSVGSVSAGDRKSTRLNSSHQIISYAVFCLKKKTHT